MNEPNNATKLQFIKNSKNFFTSSKSWPVSGVPDQGSCRSRIRRASVVCGILCISMRTGSEPYDLWIVLNQVSLSKSMYKYSHDKPKVSVRGTNHPPEITLKLLERQWSLGLSQNKNDLIIIHVHTTQAGQTTWLVCIYRSLQLKIKAKEMYIRNVHTS